MWDAAVYSTSTENSTPIDLLWVKVKCYASILNLVIVAGLIYCRDAAITLQPFYECVRDTPALRANL